MSGAASEGSVNVNTDTSVPQGDPIVKQGGEYTTFDEMASMESLDTPKAKTGKEQKSKDASKDSKVSKKDTEDPTANPKDEKEPKVEKKGKTSKEEDAEGKEPLDKKTDQFKPKKVYKVKVGDNELDIPGETTFKVKDQDVSLQDMLNEWNGKTDYNKKFQDLSVRSKEFDSTIQELNDNIAHAFKLAVTDKNPRAMIAHIAELMGADPIKTWKDLKAQIRQQMGIGEGEIDPNEDKDDELELMRMEKQRRDANTTRQKAESDLKAQVDSTLKKFGMSDKDLVQTYDAMVEAGYDKSKIDAETIGQFFTKSKSTAIANEVASELGDLENSEEVVELIVETQSKYPNFTKDDLKEVIVEALGLKDTAAKTLSRKVRAGDSSRSKPAAAKESGAVFFGDLD